ncbi:DoxX family membrane protein [Sphingomicrobium astaxanthinifaciens]|uniref:DoxX family membrane protein n=1 Tax=Sphingomicrobium astaxanthinifaciens TaxID=1227949 RepID=UPI001FCB270D|nr:DoxX family membrane protein [Sphingomicrobium astaxanthinifaciens]MCJ7421961.1 DoxX family membrane protein [Sphingomicrobium astaxanthinifaciens]
MIRPAALRRLAGHPLVTDLVLLFVRIGLGAIFWQSGRTKVEDGSLFAISDTTFFLFANDYSGVPLLPSAVAAVAATVAEHLLPLLLALGLATRLAAAGLVAMTLVIQLFVYPAAWWVPHMGWVALGLVLVTQGPGRLSADFLLDRR